MTITKQVTKSIIKRLINGEDYRIEIIYLINIKFLQFSIEFFKKIVSAKLNNKRITIDWYKKTFLDHKLSTKEIAIHSGLNKKTIHNIFNSSTKEIVINASYKHYDELYNSIKALIDNEDDLDLTLTIKLKGVSVDLNVSESLIVINTLAVKRAELRGGLWSTAGKRVEKPLMKTLCQLYQVPKRYYRSTIKENNTREDDFEREADFYFLDLDGNQHKCEVKLMGKGNPESADGAIARRVSIFIADKLSNTNKKQLDKLGIQWVELRSPDGFKRFDVILNHLKIPHKKLPDNLERALDKVFKTVFEN